MCFFVEHVNKSKKCETIIFNPKKRSKCVEAKICSQHRHHIIQTENSSHNLSSTYFGVLVTTSLLSSQDISVGSAIVFIWSQHQLPWHSIIYLSFHIMGLILRNGTLATKSRQGLKKTGGHCQSSPDAQEVKSQYQSTYSS